LRCSRVVGELETFSTRGRIIDRNQMSANWFRHNYGGERTQGCSTGKKTMIDFFSMPGETFWLAVAFVLLMTGMLAAAPE
jgi:hypothetical protein